MCAGPMVAVNENEAKSVISYRMRCVSLTLGLRKCSDRGRIDFHLPNSGWQVRAQVQSGKHGTET